MSDQTAFDTLVAVPCEDEVIVSSPDELVFGVPGENSLIEILDDFNTIVIEDENSMQALRRFTAGNRRRYIVDYSSWLREGTSVDGFTAVSSSLTAAVTNAQPLPDQTCQFIVDGGVLGEEFTVTLTMTTSYGEIKLDDVPFLVVAP